MAARQPSLLDDPRCRRASFSAPSSRRSKSIDRARLRLRRSRVHPRPERKVRDAAVGAFRAPTHDRAERLSTRDVLALHRSSRQPRQSFDARGWGELHAEVAREGVPPPSFAASREREQPRAHALRAREVDAGAVVENDVHHVVREGVDDGGRRPGREGAGVGVHGV